MIHMSWHTGCLEGDGIFNGNDFCQPCDTGSYASNEDDSCISCPHGYSTGKRGATDGSSCTSMYTF